MLKSTSLKYIVKPREKSEIAKTIFIVIIYQDLYMENEVKTHKRKTKHLVDPGDLVSEKSLKKSYKILGQV